MAINLAKIEEVRPEAEQAPSGKPAARRGTLARLASIELGGPRKTSIDDLVLLSQQLALLLQTGNSLVPSIGALATQMAPSELKSALLQVHGGMEEGQGLGDCLQQHAKVFDNLFVNIVRAGEAGGVLADSLTQLASILEIRKRLRSRVREAMTYPVVLTVIMGAVVIFMLTYMFPRFSELFADLGDELPLTTRFLMGAGDLLRSRWYIVVPIVILAGVGIRKLLLTETARSALDRIKPRLPLVGKMFEEAYLFQLFSSLGLLLRSRVPHLDAIAITSNAVRSARYAGFFTSLEEHVEAGRGVALAFQESPLLPETVKLMVTTGEASGALDLVMTRLGDHYREGLESKIRRLSAVLEPLLLVVMGVFVGTVAISFIVPLFKLSQAVH